MHGMDSVGKRKLVSREGPNREVVYPSTSYPTYSTRLFIVPTLPRRVITGLVVGMCLTLIVYAFGVEPFEVPTGSMAPALLGHHRRVDCPRCGFPVRVGRQISDRDGNSGSGYRRASCPNCGHARLHLEKVSETTGDQMLVNKHVYAIRRPRRWEMAVFRLLGKIFVKRIVGLPCELIEIRDGDLYVDGELVRKNWEEIQAVRILIFDQQYQPGEEGWKSRWEMEPVPTKDRCDLRLDGQKGPARMTYRNFLLDEQKVSAIMDEYTFNGGNQNSKESVHDFLMECDLEPVAGKGTLSVGLSDGQDWVWVELPVGRKEVTKGWQQPGAETAYPSQFLGSGKEVHLLPGKSHKVEMAFVDRRLILMLDGRTVFGPVDLQPAEDRGEVERPAGFAAEGVAVKIHGFRLYRDLHYTQAGRQGVRGHPVQLGVDQYFVLGDNSPNSEDSRFWPDLGLVPGSNLIGKPFLVHLPSKTWNWQRMGCFQIPDWSRIHWLN